MLRLIHPTEPFWLDLGYGVRVHVLPLTSSLMLAIRADMRRAIEEDGNTEEPDPQAAIFLLTRCAARHAIIGWEGVGDAEGAPVDVTPVAVDALMDIFQLCDAFRDAYIAPRLDLESEKNGSSPAPNGTSAGAQTTAAGAKAPALSAPTA